MIPALREGRVLDALAQLDGLAGAPDAAPRWLAEAILRGLLGEPARAWERMSACVAWDAAPPSTGVAFASALGRPALARALLEDVVLRGPRPDHPGSLLEHARACAALGRADEAAPALERVVGRPDLDAQHLDAQHLGELAALLEDAGRYPEAERALRGEDGDPAILETRARLALWRLDLDAARGLARRLDSVAPGGHVAARIEGAVAVLEGAPDRALEPLARARARAPTDLESALWLAEAHRAAGRLAEADAWLDRATVEGGHGFALGVLRAHVEAARLAASDPQLPPGLAAATADRAALERRYSIAFDATLAPWERAGEDLVDPATRQAFTARALSGLGGNRSATPTRLVAGVLQPLAPTPSVRRQADDALLAIARTSAEEAGAALDALVARFGDSPHPRCFRGELRLWQGAYDAARDDFEAALRIAPARWAHVGLGAAHLMRGDWARAQEAFARTAAFGPAAGATTHAYRGEGHLRFGRADDALRELGAAVDARPGRVGAWIGLALLDVGDPGTARAEIRERAPALLYLAGARADAAALEPPVLERALALLAGNRSSRIVSVVDDAGGLRVLPDPARLVAFGRSAPTLSASSADTPASLRAARELARLLARAPTLPAELPVLDLRLLSVQRVGAAIDLVIGRVAPLGRVRLRGPHAAEALAPPGLARRYRHALAQLAERMARATSAARWREARARAGALPDCDAPI